MSGIYIHIPFCYTRCRYCDFYKSTNTSTRSELVYSLVKELCLRKEELSDEKVTTVYFGGGTPSILTETEIENILLSIHKNYLIDPACEITFEANPDDLSFKVLSNLKKQGINRLSIGIQSFLDDDLKLMGRRHTADQATGSVKEAQQIGLSNISVDLIYGLPRQGLKAWEKNIDQAIQLNVPHISAYHLTYHTRTVFYNWLRQGKLSESTEDLSFEQFSTLINKLEDAEYEHYEISNFAKDHLYSRHNISYWQQKKYLGIGPSAHSYDLKSRRWNVSNLKKYIQGVNSGKPYFSQEILSEKDNYNDFIITRLRTMWGISLKEIQDLFPSSLGHHFEKITRKYIESGHMQLKDNRFILSRGGLFISDRIMEDLILA